MTPNEALEILRGYAYDSVRCAAAFESIREAEQVLKTALEAEPVMPKSICKRCEDQDDKDRTLLSACRTDALESEPSCNQHPDAPHGFMRNASHNAGRYVCECEGWSPEDDK